MKSPVTVLVWIPNRSTNMTFYIALFLASMQTAGFTTPRLERSASFEHPVNIIATSWVVLDVETGRQGNVQSVQILQGASPFSDIAIANVRQWIFASAAAASTTDAHATVVFLFRARDLFSSAAVQLAQSSKRASNHPPIPLELRDPGYPLSSVAEGAAVLELEIAQSGSVQGVRVVNDVPSLTAHTEGALRSWKFQPAMRNGTAVNGKVIVVASYLRPVVHPEPPSIVGPNAPGTPAPGPAVFRGARP
jgi:outer membrane biosynthesis protein TonB